MLSEYLITPLEEVVLYSSDIPHQGDTNEKTINRTAKTANTSVTLAFSTSSPLTGNRFAVIKGCRHPLEVVPAMHPGDGCN
jgi:hypothetical protein